jgi:predicted metal-dependent RNase
VQDEINSILFTGYIDPNELGYQLANAPTGAFVCFDSEKEGCIKIQCSERHKFSLSSHSERDDLLAIADHFDPHIALWVHGEETSTKWLSQNFAKRHPKTVHYEPSTGQKIVLSRGKEFPRIT